MREESTVLVKLGQRGTLTIPKELRQGLGEGSLLEAVRQEDGVIELRPKVTIDASQSWFWTEREVDEAYAKRRYRTSDDVESFIAHLESIPPAEDDADE